MKKAAVTYKMICVVCQLCWVFFFFFGSLNCGMSLTTLLVKGVPVFLTGRKTGNSEAPFQSI